jgi:hypothetical protein
MKKRIHKAHAVLLDWPKPIDQPEKTDNDGPYVAVAVFCEHILTEKDGTLSVIRIRDTFDIQPAPSNTRINTPPIAPIPALISFRSGGAKGKKLVSIEVTTPSGKKLKSQMNLPVIFEESQLGVNLITTIDLEIEEVGVYWFDVLIDNQIMTRMPLKINILRTPAKTELV